VTGPITGPTGPVTGPVAGPTGPVTGPVTGITDPITAGITDPITGPITGITGPVTGPVTGISGPVTGPVTDSVTGITDSVTTARAGALSVLPATLANLPLPFGAVAGAPPNLAQLHSSEAPGSPAPSEPGPLGAPPAAPSAGAGPSPFGSYWLDLVIFLFACAGLAARLTVAPAAWRSTAILALLERPG
jgi:hypothetical protein